MNNVENLCQLQQFIGRWLSKRVEKCCQELAAAERFTVDTSWAQVEDTNSFESWEVPLVFRCLRCQVSIINIFPGWDYIWLYYIINIVCINMLIDIYKLYIQYISFYSSGCGCARKFLSFELRRLTWKPVAWSPGDAPAWPAFDGDARGRGCHCHGVPGLKN